MATQRSPTDKALIDGLSFNVLREFRAQKPEGPSIVDSAGSESPIAPHDIDLELSEKNILLDKRQRTKSTRAVDAAAYKKPRSKNLAPANTELIRD
ncbi:hypothetical protein FB451DRAFT_1387116 [Mycena latifolia]|nr:hypothetical protein FB451DRAFT_1387116 [Mycena latifolia]